MHKHIFPDKSGMHLDISGFDNLEEKVIFTATLCSPVYHIQEIKRYFRICMMNPYLHMTK